jgi:transposase
MQEAVEYQNERLDHLGIVAGVCREMGMVEWLDQVAGEQRRVVSIGTAIMAMVLNGLGFSNRQLYLVPQFFENKPVEHLLGKGITADMLNDDCLGRTLDWIYDHDPTVLFAGLAQRARQLFGISAKYLHVDTTSFSVSGAYEQEGEPTSIAITSGYSRDHRADLKQWMLALVTTHEGDLPIFLRPLSGNSSDKKSIAQTVKQVMEQLRAVEPEQEEEWVNVFDSGGYSEANVRSYNAAGLKWCSRVPETSTPAKTVLEQEPEHWQELSDHSGGYVSRLMHWPQGQERWVIVRTQEALRTAQASLEKKVKKEQAAWEKRLWHLSKQTFSCPLDAEQAWRKTLKGKPVWLQATFSLQEQVHYQQRGRPRAGATPEQRDFRIVSQLRVDEQLVQREAERKACFIIATNVVDADELSDEQLIRLYKAQGSVERGFRFLKDPLFLASSVGCRKSPNALWRSVSSWSCVCWSIAWPSIDSAYGWSRRIKASPIRSTNSPSDQRCAGSSNVSKALNCSTFAWVHVGTVACLAFSPFINRSFGCLVLAMHNCIFSRLKLRNVGRLADGFLKSFTIVISIDAKKTEKVGNYTNAGKTYQQKGEAVQVEDHDFGKKDTRGKVIKAIPFGIYDIQRNKG